MSLKRKTFLKKLRGVGRCWRSTNQILCLLLLSNGGDNQSLLCCGRISWRPLLAGRQYTLVTFEEGGLCLPRAKKHACPLPALQRREIKPGPPAFWGSPFSVGPRWPWLRLANRKRPQTPWGNLLEDMGVWHVCRNTGLGSKVKGFCQGDDWMIALQPRQ